MTTGRIYPYYYFEEEAHQTKYEGRYWNANGRGIAVVAVVHQGCDWAAYIGADNGQREHDCLKWAAEHGAKLSAQDAKHFFPEIKLPYRN